MIPFGRKTRGKLISVGMLLAPVVAVQSVRLLSSGNLPPAKAVIFDPAPTPIIKKPLTERQVAAMHWLGENLKKPDLHGPMDRPDPAPTPTTPTPTIVQRQPDAPIDDTPTNLVLSAMVGTETAGMQNDGPAAYAVINHKLHRVGDTVAPGWRIITIDSRTRTLTVAHKDGRKIKLMPPTPE